MPRARPALSEAELAAKRAAAAARLRRKLPRYRATKGALMALGAVALTGAVGVAGASLLGYANASPAALTALPDMMTIDSVGQNIGMVASLVGAAQWSASRVAMWEKRIRQMRLAIKKLGANDPTWRVHWAKLKVLEGRKA